MLQILLVLAVGATDPAVIETSERRANLKLYADGNGHFVAMSTLRDMNDEIYYGDSKVFYRMTIVGGGSSSGEDYTSTLLDQRYPRGFIELHNSIDNGEVTVTCGKRSVLFKRVAKEEGKAVTNVATYKRSPHAYGAYFLARDDGGNYYYVDKGRYDDNEKAFRVFIGPRGGMKEQKLTNVVHDSGGDIFSTADGQLRLIADAKKTEWVQGSKRLVLTTLPVEDNIGLIYNDLGAYKQLRLGTPCDDL